MKKVKYLTALHGNEYMPVLALSSLGIDQIVANPKALALNQRFVDMDMNKAFGTEGSSYEEKRAREVLAMFDENDLIVDFHSTGAVTDPFVIIVDLKMVSFAKTLGLKHIVYMKHNIKSGHALIDHQEGVSVETGTHGTREAFETTLKVVSNIQSGKEEVCKLYEVYGVEEKEGIYENFKESVEGFYPVLAGETSYPFATLKARLVEEEV